MDGKFTRPVDSWYRHPGQPSSDGLIHLYNWIATCDAPPKTIVELGSADGGSAVHWASLAPDARIICVDPWTPGTGYGDDVYAAFLERTRAYGNIEHMRMSAEDAALLFTRGYIDMLYIDAVHEYGAMKGYFRLYNDLIRADGWYAGHDYSRQFPGVIAAVKEECAGVPITFCDTSFLFRRGPR